MNAIIALCHFCELHGPRILFSTQGHRNNTASSISDDGTNRGASDMTKPRTESQVSIASGSDRSSSAGTPKTELCEACRSIPQGHAGFASHDPEAGISYTSSQHPTNPQIFTNVRQACIRSLSCEVCPGREGPIFFGDEDYGYTLSYTFFVKDSKARGFQRWYSIIVVMMDRIFLLNSWPFLTTNLRLIIDKIQGKAVKVYEHEQNEASQRAQRVNEHMYRRRVGGSQSFRSLVELTNDRRLFHYLHIIFVWVLRAGGSRLTEKVLEGPPREDTYIDFENEEETEEGFIKVMTKPCKETENEDYETYQDSGPLFTSLYHFRNVIGSLNFHDLVYHLLVGNQIIVRCEHKSTIKSLFDALKTLLPSGCGETIIHSDKYEESFKCNFLGLSLSVPIPEHVIQSELYILLDIIPADKNPADPLKVLVDPQDPFHGYGIKITSSAIVPDKVPQFQSRVEGMMDNTNLNESIINTFLITIKEEWMNKVKMLFKFTRAGNHSEDETNKLLKILKTEKEDEPLLKFWITGLSAQYRSHLLTSSMSQTS